MRTRLARPEISRKDGLGRKTKQYQFMEGLAMRVALL
jgi:hypothetical protein